MKYSMGETSQFSSDNINMNSYFAEVSSLLFYFLCPVYCVMFIEMRILLVCVLSLHIIAIHFVYLALLLFSMHVIN